MLLQAPPPLTRKLGAGGRAASPQQPPLSKQGAGVLQSQVLQDSISLQEVLMSATLERSFELHLEVRPPASSALMGKATGAPHRVRATKSFCR